MKKVAARFFKTLSTAAFVVAAVSVVPWSFLFSYQPECPEEIVR